MNFNELDLPTYRLYGDNILECENVLVWLTSELSPFKLKEQYGSIERPVLLFDCEQLNQSFFIQLCPYYGGTGNALVWQNDPLNSTFNEKPDALISKVGVDGFDEKPLVAIEFCDALQAGNQAWQRFKRVLDPIELEIPYLYVLPIIGWERDSEGLVLKNPRYQSAQITLAQLSVSGKLAVPSLQIYKDTPWAKLALETNKYIPNNYKDIISEKYAIEYVTALIINSLKANTADIKMPLKNIVKSMLGIARFYSSFSNTNLPIHKNHPALNPVKLEEVADEYANAFVNKKAVSGYNALHEITFKDFTLSGVPFYKDLQKKTSSEEFYSLFSKYFNFKSKDFFSESEKLMIWSESINPPHEKSDFPITYKSKKSEAFIIRNKTKFIKFVMTLYPDIDNTVINWINTRQGEFVVIPMYGYKPSGDSRPDRGLVPMIYALFPQIAENGNILVIMYSKYTPINWKNLISNRNNELWNTIRRYSGAVIVDKTKSGLVIQNYEA